MEGRAEVWAGSRQRKAYGMSKKSNTNGEIVEIKLQGRAKGSGISENLFA